MCDMNISVMKERCLVGSREFKTQKENKFLSSEIGIIYSNFRAANVNIINYGYLFKQFKNQKPRNVWGNTQIANIINKPNKIPQTFISSYSFARSNASVASRKGSISGCFMVKKGSYFVRSCVEQNRI